MPDFMDAGARNWMYKFVRKNYWRVAAWIDYDDLVQDGYAAYYETRMRYPTAVEAAHIMRLFQLVFRSKIEDLVRANTKQVDDARSDLVEIFESPNMIIPDFSSLHALLIKAPQTIKDVLTLMTDDRAREELIKPFERYENGRRETLNDRFCRLLGKDPNSTDLVSDLRMYFES
jgi:hypothetical protein